LPVFPPFPVEPVVEFVLGRVVVNLPIGGLSGGDAAVQVRHLLQGRRPLARAARAARAEHGRLRRGKIRRQIVEVPEGARARQPSHAYLRRCVVDVAQAAECLDSKNDHQ
jgi:hypothetical protein